uniref:Condensin II complex subunit n=1 Tax=Podoviridae sp. ctIlt3 TaxID=2825239 RepID=A0A8S5U9Z5_9CAUD|nr:MAG TPA: Condensin II complex subunit [Podoviridae sp. ctIlt3]
MSRRSVWRGCHEPLCRPVLWRSVSAAGCGTLRHCLLQRPVCQGEKSGR